MRVDRYSRMVAWLKVVLPLAALALLSTLFLLSRDSNPETAIPFADKEIQDRLRDQQVTGPFFSGTTPDGDQISFSAVKLTTPGGQTGANEAEKVLLRAELSSGMRVLITADRAQIDIASDLAALRGGVEMTTSTGYVLSTPTLTSQMTSLEIIAPEPVTGTSPIGTLDAGSMTLTLPQQGANAQLLFKNGVKLVYSPN